MDSSFRCVNCLTCLARYDHCNHNSPSCFALLLQASSTKVDSHNHMISIYNAPAGADSAAVKTAVSDALKKADLAKVASVQSVSTFAKPTVTLRYSADKDWSVESLREALGKVRD